MNSEKSPNAPPPEYNPPPPSYQDHPQYPNPAQGYPPQQVPQQGYGYPPQYGGAPPIQQYPLPPGNNVVTVQPVYITRPPLANPVNDYMGYSVFTLLCCFLPLGVAALIYSIMARDANHSGDQVAAERNSNTARKLNHVSLGIGITVIILMIIFMAVR